MHISNCDVNLTDFQQYYPLHGVTVLSLIACQLTNANLILFSKHLLPNMSSLKTLDIENNRQTPEHQDGLLEVFQQLTHSNVTTLNIAGTGLCEFSACSALKHLIDPSSGILEELSVGTEDCNDEELAHTLSPPHCLKTLSLHYPNMPLYHNIEGLTKRCVTHSVGTWDEQAPHIAEILKHNRTLQHLELSEFDVGIGGEGVRVLDIDALRIIITALHENSTLQSIDVTLLGDEYYFNHEEGKARATSFMKQFYMYEELTLESRVTYACE